MGLQLPEVTSIIRPILNSHSFGRTGRYLPIRVINHGVLTGYISINRSWACYEAHVFVRNAFRTNRPRDS